MPAICMCSARGGPVPLLLKHCRCGPLLVGRDRCGPRHGGRKSFAGPPVCLVDQPYILLTKRPCVGCGPTPSGRYCRATVALLLALRCSNPPSPSDSPLGHAKCGSAQDAGARVGSEQVAPLAARGSLGASRWSDVGRQSCDARVQRRAPARTSAATVAGAGPPTASVRRQRRSIGFASHSAFAAAERSGLHAQWGPAAISVAPILLVGTDRVSIAVPIPATNPVIPNHLTLCTTSTDSGGARGTAQPSRL